MKTIKIKICGYDPQNEFSYGRLLLNILKKHYIVELSAEPEYIFFNESTDEYLEYDCIRIFYTGENITPNFNLCDYAFGFDYLNFEDRYFRLPVYFGATFYNKKDLENAGDLDFVDVIPFIKSDLALKQEFCSFVYSNYLASDERGIFFDKLNKYKKVNSGGKYLNNIGGPVNSKLDFEKKHKFSIAFENSSRSGYTTEKILTSFAANTIPIYWGNPKIGEEFNTKRFINCHDYETFDEVIDKIIEIDNDDSMYLNIMNEPVRNTDYDFKEIRARFELFLKNIFDQDLVKAKRCVLNKQRSKDINNNEKIIFKIKKFKLFIRKILSFVYRPFKCLRFLEKIKVNYLKK